ncbi:MAG: CBS domain-containing protein [Proteobacteria bacterium]|nr:CBS domain-containing protein [Pseudomonadota bacterium]MBU1709889.1 CBS domain-containing protein [Pseudomonadota bacterium]
MTKNNDVHAVPAEVVMDFLKKTMPFNELEPDELNSLAKQCQIDFYPKGTRIFQQDVTEVMHFFLIQKGGVRIYLQDEGGGITLKDFRGEGEYFGALPIIQETKANLNVETIEDTFCFLFSKEAFLHLVRSSPRVAQYYLKSFSEKLVKTAYHELRQRKVGPRLESGLYLFNARVGDIVKGVPRAIVSSDSVQFAAAEMARHRIGSLLVNDASGKLAGIVTDKDLRTKVVAVGLKYETPVSEIMTEVVHKIQSHSVCFDALLKMMSNRIHHLVVESNEEIIGVITTHDIMVLQGTSPIYIFREIAAQREAEGLYEIAGRTSQVVRSLIEDGAKANNITRMITVLNDHILEKLLSRLVVELGNPPVSFCWLLMGSEGRREQTFMTDQDNAIIYSNPVNEKQAKAAEEYFKVFGEKAIEHLVKCGYPRCPGDIMASNPRWRQSYATWEGYFDRWIMTPNPEEVLNATIFFDFRGGFGDLELANALRKHLAAEAAKRDIFLLHLARDCQRTRPPLSFFKNLIVEKDGEHKDQLDFKTRGLVPFVDFARLMSLKHGVQETNTLVRLQLLQEREAMPRELYLEMIEAYEFLMQLRLVHQLQKLEDGKTPDNYINPKYLSDLEKRTLKEAFAVIQRMQNFIQYEFKLVNA